jgi:hypothetical protein
MENLLPRTAGDLLASSPHKKGKDAEKDRRLCLLLL